MADLYGLLVGGLAVWRVTHLFHSEDGPWDLLFRFRQWLGTGASGQLLDCFYCLSLWVAVPAAIVLGEGWTERVLLIPALSAGAILLERALHSERHAARTAPTVEYVDTLNEGREESVGLLRKEENR